MNNVDVFRWVPFLAILERRRDLLPEHPEKVSRNLLDASKKHLRSIVTGKTELSPVSPSQFFLEANLVAFSPSKVLWERFARYYANLSLRAFVAGDPLLDRHYPPRGEVPVPEYLRVPRPFPELLLYHVEVDGGIVRLRRPYLFRASLLYADILSWIEKKVRPIVTSGSLEELRKHAQEVMAPPGPKKGRYGFIKKILSLSGLPDGRKRILFYWLIPYWVTVEGRSPEEVLELANRWIAQQGGGKIYSSWILSEAENVRTKGIKPWSINKVERVDPDLIKLLRSVGAL